MKVKLRQRESLGFTLIELLVVIAIIGILASLVLASLSTARERARDGQRFSDMSQVRLALQFYWDANNSIYPATVSTGCGPTCLSSLTSALVDSGFLPYIPLDPIYGDTTNGYRYCRPGTDTGSYTLLIRTEKENNWCMIKHQAMPDPPALGDPHVCWIQDDGQPGNDTVTWSWCDEI